MHCLTACKLYRGISCVNRGKEQSDVLQNRDCADVAELMADDDLYFFDEEVV